MTLEITHQTPVAHLYGITEVTDQDLVMLLAGAEVAKRILTDQLATEDLDPQFRIQKQTLLNEFSAFSNRLRRLCNAGHLVEANAFFAV